MAKLKNNNGQLLEQVDLGSLPHSSWYDGFSVKGTMNLGTLVPSRVREMLPADTISCGGSSYSIQFQPLAVPTLDNLYHTHDTFKVPYRILWNEWEKFWTKGENLDYVGKVPSFNYATILDAVFGSGIFGSFRRQMIKKIRFKDDITLYDFQVQPSGGLYAPLIFTITNSELSSMRSNLIDKATEYGMLDLIDNVLDAFDSFLDWYDENKIYYQLDGDNDLSTPHEGIMLSKIVMTTDSYVVEPFVPERYNHGELANLSYPLNIDETLFEFILDTSVFYEQSPLLQRISTFIEQRFINQVTNVGNSQELVEQFNRFMPMLDVTNLISLVDTTYALIKPLFGLGSIIDYLGYGAYKKEDLLTAFFYRFTAMDALTDGAMTFYFDGDDFPTKPENALKLRAYYAIWYWNYRDVLIETLAPEPVKTNIIDGDELFRLVFTRFRCWEKDTYTTALANTGDGSVVVPTQNVIDPDGTIRIKFNSDSENDDFVTPIGKDMSSVKTIGADIKSFQLRDGTRLEFPTRFLMGHTSPDDSSYVGANALDTGGFSLDMFDRARAVQKWLVKALICGNRPEDALYTRWRVKYSDVRLQLPEHIVRGTSLVRIDTLVNNTTTEVSNAGDKSANMHLSSNEQGKFKEYFEEHGVLITLQSIIPNSDYGYGASRSSFRFDAFDYPDPDFAQLGFDAVYTDELVCSRNNVSVEHVLQNAKISNSVLGYQRRYYDFVTKHNEIHGELLDTMDKYTFARKFSAYNKEDFPQLTPRFVHCHPRTEMFVYDPKKVDLCWFDCYHDEKLNRALPMFSKVF